VFVIKRIALIGDNSLEYINKLLEIWNDGNCAVLIDWRIPVPVAYEMMSEAKVQFCYIEQKFSNDYDVENIIKKEFPIDDCVVLKKKSTMGDYLVCLYTGNSEVENMRIHLNNFLMSYEIPREFHRVSEIPSTTNGKKLRMPL